MNALKKRAVTSGVSPGGTHDRSAIELPISSSRPGGRMPPSTAGRRPAATWRALLYAVCGLAFGLLNASAQTNRAPSRLDYDSFRVITDRNIFSPRRYARSYRPERTRFTRSDAFALVGTMSYEKGPFAFFDGTSSDYRKVLKPEDTIAGFKVLQISPSEVKLASPTNEVQLHIGMQMRHSDDGQWQVSERTETSEPAPAPRGPYSRFQTQFNGQRSATGSPDQPGSTNVAEGDLPPGPDGGPPAGVVDQPPTTGSTDTAPATPPTGGDDVLERLRRRAAAERGENPQ